MLLAYIPFCPIGLSSVTGLHAILSYRTEPQIFKTRFKAWNDCLAVDFTRTPEMLEKRKMELVCYRSSLGVCRSEYTNKVVAALKQY